MTRDRLREEIDNENIEAMTQTEKALAAMRAAFAKEIEEHCRDNMPLAIWRDGKVVWISPHDFSTTPDPAFEQKTEER